MSDLNDRIDRPRIVREFAEVINRNCLESPSNTPDFALAEYLVMCLEAFNQGLKYRKEYYDKNSMPENQDHSHHMNRWRL